MVRVKLFRTDLGGINFFQEEKKLHNLTGSKKKNISKYSIRSPKS